MAKIIEARAVISAEDRTGAVFDKIAKKIDGLGKAAKTSKAVDQMAKSLERAKTQMVAIDKFDMSRGGLAASRQRFNEMKVAVEGAARAMAATPSREMEASMRRARTQVAAASRAYENQKNIAISHKRALEGMGINIAQAAAHQTRLRAAIEKTSGAIERQERVEKRSAARRLAVGGALAVGGGMAAHGVFSGARAVIRTYREFDKERRYNKAVMGQSDEEQAPMVNQAIRMGATTKYNDIQVLEAQRELGARGLKKDQIMGMMEPAAQLGMALDLKLPDAVKQMEGAIFGFKKDISSLPAAMASARQTADYQVKAAKLSGMTPEDLSQLYKFGATPARMGGVSEASLLGFGGILKKANIGGDEAGVAFRALMSTVQSPTAGGKTALLANGLNYKDYQRTKDSLDVDPFAADVAARYGVKLDGKTRGALGSVFSNKDLISDPAKFAPAVTGVLKESLGGNDAKSLKSISGAANRYRDASVNSIDANAMIKDLLPKLANNLPLANKLFGAKQGGRIATALGDGDTLKRIIQEIEKGSEGYSGKISRERMAGFDGAVSRFEGAVKNLETAVGRSFDNDGKGGILTWGADRAGGLIQHLAELDGNVIAVGASFAGLAGVGLGGYGAFKFLQILTTGGGLTASAVALDGAAAALTAAAAGLNGGAVAKTAATAAPGMAAAAWGAGASALPLLVPGVMLAASYPLTKDASNPGAGASRAKRGGTMRHAYRSQFNEDRARQGLPPLNSPFGSPEMSPTMTYGTGVGGAVTAQLTGSADIRGVAEIVVRFEAGSELVRVVEGAKATVRMSGRLNPNGPGSQGTSSPMQQHHRAALAEIGKMTEEFISIVVGGMRYSAFENVSVNAAFNKAARGFQFDVAAELGASATNAIFAEGPAVQIYANKDLLLTGYVDCREPQLDANSATISVSGRSSSQDLIDGAAEHDTGRFEKKDPKQIGEEVSKNYLGTGFETDQQLEKVDQYQLTPGETVYRAVEKLARQQGMTLAGTPEGKIKITKAGTERHSGGLFEGVNIKRGRATHNGANRHSQYTVRGQRPFDHGVDNLEINVTVRDRFIKRHRPFIGIEDGDTTKARAKSRARNRRDRAAGNALKATIDTQGFRDTGGKIWTPGHLVWTESPFLDIAQDMLIESVTYRQDDKGSIATLQLTDPRSYGGEGGKGNKSGAEWSQESDEGDGNEEL